MLNKMNLQLFADGEPTPDTAPAAGKTYSEDYVHTIREEAKENRIARKAEEAARLATEAKLKALLGLKPEDAIDDAKIAAHTANQQKAIQAALEKANERLLIAEIKGMDGYDAKLVERLLDKSKVQIAEDGTVTGLKEAISELEKEFPAIKKTGATAPSGNPATPPALTDAQQLEAQYEAAKKAGRNAEAIAIKRKLFDLNKK